MAIASAGAILAIMLLSILSPSEELSASLHISFIPEESLFRHFLTNIGTQLIEVAMAISPLFFMFLAYQLLWLQLPKRRTRKIWIGFVYVFVGLVFFLTGVNAGFMGIGSVIGYTIGENGSYRQLYLIGLALGMVSILAEPAVSVLTSQIEQVTSGAIKRVSVIITLCIGVGLAIFLSAVRLVVPWLELWHILLPGYLIAIGLSYIVPKIFVGMAFDAGGVASGPMTATFILAFIQGAAEAIPHANILTDGFGMIALVALMPILTLQLFGFIYYLKTREEV